MIIDAKPKRKSRAKPKVDEVMAKMSTEDLKEEVKPSTVSDKSYKVILKPTVIIPTIGLK